MVMLKEQLKKARFMKNFVQKKLAHLNLQILYQCNFKCQICDFWTEDYQKMPKMSVPQVKTVAEQLKKIGPQLISIGGGEPLMHKDIIEICDILGKDNLLVMICNGWFVTEEIAQALWATGIYEISISVDFADPKKHDQMRGKEGAFERAVNALKLLQENRKYPYQRINMISTVTNENIGDIEALIQLCRDIGVTFLVSCYSDGRGEQAENSPDIDFSSHLLDLKKRYKEFVSVRGYLAKFTEHAQNPNGITPCFAGKNLFNIDCQGDVSMCIDMLDDPAGNIFEDDMDVICDKLIEQQKVNTCGKCWTSCRGPIETLMYGENKLINYWDNYQLTKSLPLS